MNILYYIPNLSQEWGGVRQYAKGVLQMMSGDAANRYFVYHNIEDPEIMKVLSSNSRLTLIKDTDLTCFNKYKWRFIELLNSVSRNVRVCKQMEINYIEDLCKQFFIDAIHCPFQFIPKTGKTKLITTLHDVQELHFPEFFTPEIRAYRAVNYTDYLFRADKVIVSYEHVKNDIVKYFRIPADKIEILLLNMNDLWINRFWDDKSTDAEVPTTGDDFLLYPANTWKHKNHLNLIRAVGLLRDKFGVRVKIVCTGNKNEHFETLNLLLQELELEDQVVFTGIVSEQRLYSLYRTCRATVVPSLYEAGSFPLYESILLNVPVICSRVTSLPETIGNEDCLFDPSDICDIAGKIKEIWTNENFRNKARENLKQAREKITSNDPLPVLKGIYSSLEK